MPEHAAELRFGDFDADGRTDVVALHGARLDVSWAGISPWHSLNAVGWALSNLAIGDFDGDLAADIFLATGSEWFYAAGGKTWRHLAYSDYSTQQLRFGDFDADGKTDIFGIVAGQWQIVPGGGDAWEPLRTALITTVAGLVVADFDGDGYADVARHEGGSWQYAARGWGGFVTLRRASNDQPIALAPVGRFDGDARADVLIWKDLHFWIAPGARDPLEMFSRQALR